MTTLPKEIAFKIYTAPDSKWDQKKFIPVFHRWIRESVIEDELLIDVTDYTHVHHGPGVMLIGHEANYSMDEAHGRTGLFYRRKQTTKATLQERIDEALVAALRACKLLEKEPTLAGLAFDLTAFDFTIQNRLYTASADIDAAVQSLLSVAEQHIAAPLDIQPRHLTAKECFSVQLRGKT